MYATVEDLEARWRTLTSSEDRARAEVLLEDAAVRLDVVCPPPASLTAAELSARKIVSCEMVKRAMISPAGVGVNSVQQGAGPYQETVQYTNPSGDLYLTKADKALLKCGGQRAFMIDLATPPHPPEVWP